MADEDAQVGRVVVAWPDPGAARSRRTERSRSRRAAPTARPPVRVGARWAVGSPPSVVRGRRAARERRARPPVGAAPAERSQRVRRRRPARLGRRAGRPRAERWRRARRGTREAHARRRAGACRRPSRRRARPVAPCGIVRWPRQAPAPARWMPDRTSPPFDTSRRRRVRNPRGEVPTRCGADHPRRNPAASGRDKVGFMTEGSAPANTDVAGCTVATRNYLADARLAARSFLDHHPGSRFVILVVDGDHMPPADWSHRDVEMVTPTELGFDSDELLRMAAIYDPAELACALKPWALRRALTHAEVAIYVDGDVEILAPMPELIDAGRDHAVVLVPHLLEPMPRDGRLPDEPGLLGAGIYNGGAVGLWPGLGALPGVVGRAPAAGWPLPDRPHAPRRPALARLRPRPVRPPHPAGPDLRRRLLEPARAPDGLARRPALRGRPAGALLPLLRPHRCPALAAERVRRRPPPRHPGRAARRGPPVPGLARAAPGRRGRGRPSPRLPLGPHRPGRRPRRPGPLALPLRPPRRGGRSHRHHARPRPPPSPPTAARPGRPGCAARRDRTASGATSSSSGTKPASSNSGSRRSPGPTGTPSWPGSTARPPTRPPSPPPSVLDPRSCTCPAPTRPAPPTRRPPRPAAAAQLPLADLDRAHRALDTPARSAPGMVGKVVDRLLAGRDERSTEATTALADAVADLARRLADLSDRLDRHSDAAATSTRTTGRRSWPGGSVRWSPT